MHQITKRALGSLEELERKAVWSAMNRFLRAYASLRDKRGNDLYDELAQIGMLAVVKSRSVQIGNNRQRVAYIKRVAFDCMRETIFYGSAAHSLDSLRADGFEVEDRTEADADANDKAEKLVEYVTSVIPEGLRTAVASKYGVLGSVKATISKPKSDALIQAAKAGVERMIAYFVDHDDRLVGRGLRGSREIAGKKFGHLTPIRRAEGSGHCRRILWECRCDCGAIVTRSSATLGKKNSACSLKCPSLVGDRIRGHPVHKRRFGHLVVIRPIGSTGGRGILWECRCDCGATTAKSTNALTRPHAKFCSGSCPLLRESISDNNRNRHELKRREVSDRCA